MQAPGIAGRFSRGAFIVWACGLLASCGEVAGEGFGADFFAITDGNLDYEHLSVGVVQTADGGTISICSGTLIGRHTVLTAAHCLRPGQPHAFRLGGQKYVAQRVMRHEQYDATTSALPHDIGLVILASAPPVEPAYVTKSAPRRQTQVVLVGYGITDDGLADGGQKRVAVNYINEVTERRFSYAGTGAGLGSTCVGDSGGPAFATYEGQEYVVGVTSTGVAPCGTLSWDTRVDAYHDWILMHAAGDVATPAVHPERTALVSIVEPADNSVLPRPFELHVAVREGYPVQGVRVLINGAEEGSIVSPPYRTALDLIPGPQTLQVAARDADGNESVATVRVVVRGDGQGTFGEACTTHAQCSGGICAHAGSDRFCTRLCQAAGDAASACGTDGSCMTAGGLSFCAPATVSSPATAPPDTSTAGCAIGTSAGPPALPALPVVLLVLIALVAARRH